MPPLVAPQSKTVHGIPKSRNPLVIRTDFSDPKAWETVCKLIRAPVPAPGDTFYAYVEFLDDAAFRDLSKEDLLARIGDYNHFFVFVVDHATITSREFPVLVIDLHRERGRSFRAIPSMIQSIENNLSISNMDFFEFANAADKDGIVRGFTKL